MAPQQAPPEYADEIHLGDGLYCALNMFGQIRLRAPRGEGDHICYLEPEVLASFLDWCIHKNLIKGFDQ
jgi:hypothetical protein